MKRVRHASSHAFGLHINRAARLHRSDDTTFLDRRRVRDLQRVLASVTVHEATRTDERGQVGRIWYEGILLECLVIMTARSQVRAMTHKQ